MNSQFEPFDSATHPARLAKIKAVSKKQTMDEGPVALYHCLWQSRAQGHHAMVEFAIKELEKIYNINEVSKC